jgi:hypothetical protein
MRASFPLIAVVTLIIENDTFHNDYHDSKDAFNRRNDICQW